MCDTINLFGYQTFENFMDGIEDKQIVVECLETPIMCELILDKKEKKKKSVRFMDEDKVKTFDEPRENNICPKYYLPNSLEDVHQMYCRSGMYLEEEELQLVLIENNLFNSGDEVNDKELKKITNIMKKQEINVIKERKKLTNVREIVTEYLTGNQQILNKVSKTLILDCVIYMMEVYEHLEKEGASYTFDYKSGVTISNREGKRQRNFLKKKIEYVTNKFL